MYFSRQVYKVIRYFKIVSGVICLVLALPVGVDNGALTGAMLAFCGVALVIIGVTDKP